MTGIATTPRGGHGWQLILADLALILFLLTLSALPAAEATSGKRLADSDATEKDAKGGLKPEVAAAQALFRPVPGGPSLAAWLAAQAPDPRTTLTIFVSHTAGSEADAWARAEELASEARASGARVRTIIMVGGEEDLYASLAYDTVVADMAEDSGEGRNKS